MTGREAQAIYGTQAWCRWCVLLACLLLLGRAMAAPTPTPGKPYRYYAVGAPQAEVRMPQRPAQPSFVLMGGGRDVDAAFAWMIRKAGIRPGTGGRFVILRATGTAAYDPYIYYSGPERRTGTPVSRNWVGGAALGLSSVETLVIPSSNAANDLFVNAVLARADAVFIAGGDQSDYILFWKGTKLDRTLQALLQRNTPIGGTSAGLAILGAFNFAALRGTIGSEQALADPFDPRITIDPDPLDLAGGFLPLPALADTITDSHFDRRKRMGRLLTFVSRLVAPQNGAGCRGGILPTAAEGITHARGIGVSEQTALLVEGEPDSKHFTARMVANPGHRGQGAVYFVRLLEPPATCQPGQALTIRRVEVRKLADPGTVFDLSNWSGVAPYLLRVEAGEFDADPY